MLPITHMNMPIRRTISAAKRLRQTLLTAMSVASKS